VNSKPAAGFRELLLRDGDRARVVGDAVPDLLDEREPLGRAQFPDRVHIDLHHR